MRMPPTHHQRQQRHLHRRIFPPASLHQHRMNMPLQMIHRHQRFPHSQRQSLRIRNPHQQSPGQSRPLGHRNRIQIRKSQPRRNSRGLHHRRPHHRHNVPQMFPRSQLRHHPPIV